MRLAAILLTFLSLPALVAAGPWPREEGTVFLSFSSAVTTPRDAVGTDLQTSYTAYLERGLARSLTFGADSVMEDTGAYSVIVFLRKPVLEGGGAHRFAVQIGLGATTANGGAEEWLVQGGASWGRGFEIGEWGGWMTLDAQVQYLPGSGKRIGKADLTLGLKPSESLKLMLQVQSGDYPGSAPYLRLEPSVARKFGDSSHVKLGAQIGIAGDDRLGASLGTWLEF